MQLSSLGVSTVSRAVVDAAVAWAEQQHSPLMLVASRNQVEDADLGGGYSGFTPQSLVSHVRARTELVQVCRDHGGPYFSDADAGLSPEAAADRALESLRRDVAAGFDLLHVDWSRGAGDVVAETLAVIDCLQSSSPNGLRFEVGTDETDGGVDRPERFAEDLRRFASQPGIDFVVGRTGSLVRERFQVGYFEFSAVRKLTAVAHELGFRFKEHNADYSAAADLRLRAAAGVDAVNIGPELGVLETTVVARAASEHGLDAELSDFFDAAVASRRWTKWSYGAEPSARMKAVVAGHYCQSSPQYQALLARLRERVDIDALVHHALASRIGRYVACLGAEGVPAGAV